MIVISLKNSIIILLIFTIGIIPVLTLNAFAASGISSAVADDPDDADTVYSVDDTITITFPADTNSTSGGTMTNAEFRANFTATVTDLDTADTLSGTWTSKAILTLTIDTIAGNDPPVINTDTFEFDTTNGDIGYVNGTLFTGDAVTLTGDFGIVSSSDDTSSGSGCEGDCEEPTLGVDSTGKRLVSNGFTYNGHSVDVDRYFTPYPLITAEVGKLNTAVFKIYENLGPENIRHFSFAYGLGQDQVISESKAMIELGIAFDRTETVTVTDPENALDNVSVKTSTGLCMPDSSSECLIVTIRHIFREPLDFNIVATDVWDTKRSSWQNYYNHGIEVVGPSMNPPDEHDGTNQGQIYHLTETSKTTAVDEFGNTWSLKYGQWMMDYVKADRVSDPPTQIMTRAHSDFDKYKTEQTEHAIPKLLELCPTCLKPYDDFEDSYNIEYPDTFSKLNDPKVLKSMYQESSKADRKLQQIYDQSYPSKVFD